jgi:hypothetical protein
VKYNSAIMNFDKTNIKNNAYFYVEAGKVHLDAVTKIFKIDIELYYFDGALNNNSTKFISSKKLFKYNNELSTPKIFMFYNLTHFSKFYTPELFTTYREILRTPVTHLNSTIFFEDNFKCDICNTENNRKVYFKKQNITGCLNCIKNKTDKILDERALGLMGDNYMSRECK